MTAVDWRAQSYIVEISTKSTLSHVTKLLTPHPLNAAQNPAIMKKCVRSFIVSQINTLTRVAHDIACSWIGQRPTPHQFLQICDLGWGNYARLSAVCLKFQRSDVRDKSGSWIVPAHPPPLSQTISILVPGGLLAYDIWITILCIYACVV